MDRLFWRASLGKGVGLVNRRKQTNNLPGLSGGEKPGVEALGCPASPSSGRSPGKRRHYFPGYQAHLFLELAQRHTFWPLQHNVFQARILRFDLLELGNQLPGWAA